MSKQQLNVPATLIEQEGTGEDTHGLIGKRVRLVNDPTEGVPAFILAAMGVPPFPLGAEGVVVHIGESGEAWADFDGAEDVEPNVNGDRVMGIGYPEGDERNEGEPALYEVIA